MTFLKRYPVFCVLIAIFTLVFIAGVWMWRSEISRIQAEENSLAQDRNRVESLGRGVLVDPDTGEMVAPTRENLEILEARRDKVLADLVTIRNNLEAQAENVFGESADEFTFLPSLQSYISRYTNRARAANIKLNEEEAFGFNRYFREARNPPSAAIPKMDKQRQILEYLLSILYESGPTSIVSVEREPIEISGREEIDRLVSAYRDLFIIDPLISIGGSEYIHTLSFRITFTGRTDTLRRFLNRLALFELPIIVRSIDVRPVEEAPRASRRRAASTEMDSLFDLFGGGAATPEEPASSGREPVITENQSRFSVVVEFIEIDLDPETLNKERGA